jgi:hypothetical protein
MPAPGQPRRTTRNIGTGIAAAAVIVASGVVYDQMTEPEPRMETLSAPASVALLRDGFEGESGGAPVPPVDLCAGPLVKPGGMRALPVTWEKMWSSKRPGAPQTAFPNSPGFPVGIGAGMGEYQQTSFVPLPETTGQIFFEPHQARPHEGEPMGRPAYSMLVTVSPCPGDLRPPALRPKCSVVANTGTLTWTTKTLSSPVCKLEAGVRHYIAVSPVDPRDGVVVGDNTCKFPDAPPCWVQAKHTPL